MRNNTKNRFISGLLAGVIMLNQVPVFAAAEDTGLCDHHTLHEDCGYVEGISGSQCAHEHIDCYVLAEECVHDHVDCGYSEIPEENLCDHQCTEDSGCVTEQFNCVHEHDDGCYYREEVVAQPCTYECQQCAEANNGDPATVDVLDDQTVQIVDSGTCGENLTWTLNDAGILTISGNGNMYNYTFDDSPWKNLNVNEVEFTGEITNIGDYAFNMCQGLTEITIPDTVTKIGEFSFNGCMDLERIILSKNLESIHNTTFIECPNLKTIQIDGSNFNYYTDSRGVLYNGEQTILIKAPSAMTGGYVIPNSVIEIADNGFFGCSELQSIIIPDSVTKIGDSVFYYCIGLSTISIPESVQSLGDYLFSLCENLITVNIPAGITEIKKSMFNGCCALTGIKLPDSITMISENAFNGCSNLSTIKIPDNVSIIADSAFSFCHNLNDIIIPENVTSLGRSAFRQCYNLSKIHFLGNIPTIGYDAFASVTADAYYPINNETWTVDLMQNYGGDVIWSGYFDTCGENLSWLFDETTGALTISGRGKMIDFIDSGTAYVLPAPWFRHMAAIKQVVISDGISSVGAHAFSGFENIESVTLPDGLTSIGDGSFGGCRNLTELKFPTSLKHIGVSSFATCQSVEKVSIPEGITIIPENAFAFCSKLEQADLPKALEIIGEYAFSGCENLDDIHIPISVDEIKDLAFAGCVGLKNITFAGDAPQIDELAFNEVIATAYYPANNPSWTSNTMLHYGGTITWLENVTTGSCGEDATWALDHSTGTLTISGTGSMDNFSNEFPWEIYRDVVKSVVIENGITTIGEGAFTEYQELRTLSISATVSDISLHAIKGCNNLESITVASDNETYLSENGILFNKDKTALLKYPATKADGYYTIPDSVVTIEEYAFYGCSNLNNVFISDSVSTIRFQAFVGCSGLTNINIPDSVTTIDATAFAECTSLSVANIGNGINYLNNYVFEYCTSLHIVHLPETLSEIWENAFAYCSSLKRIELPSGMNLISDGAFHDCTALEEIVINGVKEIYWSFENCTALKTVIFTSDAPDYCTDAFQTLTLTAYYPAGNNTWTDAKRQSFGGNITWIASNASGNCGDNLTWDFNAGTLTITGDGTMYDYSQDQTKLAPWAHLGDYIKKLVIDEGVTSIGDYAFYSCKYLNYAALPASISRVGVFSFASIIGERQYVINQTVRQWSKVQNETQYFPNWETTQFINNAPVMASGVYGKDVYWELDNQGNMVFFGSGPMYDFGAVPTHWSELKVKTVTIDEGITSIGIGAFEVNETDLLSTSLSSITISSTVTSIAGNAFSNCVALKTVTFTGDAPKIADNAFNNVSATAYYPAGNDTWTDAVMQDYGGNITWKPRNATSGVCGENLTWLFDEKTCTLTISGTGDMYDHIKSTDMPWYTFRDQILTIDIQSGVTSLGMYAFEDCTNLKQIALPDSLTSIGMSAFLKCTSLERIVIPNSVTEIPYGLFIECSKLEEVTLPDGITSIGEIAFANCTSLSRIDLPNSITSVGVSAFVWCSSLKEIRFLGDAPAIEADSFAGVTATAYYPAGNSTWTASVMHDYKGAITWVPYCYDSHNFNEWITEGNNSSRTCIHCGYTEHKVVTDSGDVEIEIPEQPDLEVEVDPVLPSENNYILVEEALDSVGNQDQAILKVFDITLKNANGVHVQPNGTVKVKLPLDQSQKGNYKVYRINDDGTLTDMLAYRQGNHMVFETDHFSLYVIVEKGHQHDYQKVVTAPDCTKDGFTTYTCGCGSSYVDDEVTALGHSYDNGKVTTKPTCMTAGVKTYTCGSCGDTKTESVEKDPKNHSFTKYESDKNATCKKNGTKTANCDYGCGKTDTVTDRGSKLGHKYQGDKCIRCGVTKWNPDTGDKIMIAVTVLVISGSALLILLLRKKRK